MSSKVSDRSASQEKASSYDPFEATASSRDSRGEKSGAKVDPPEKSSPALINLMSSYKDQRDSESSGEKDNIRLSSTRRTERSKDSDSSLSPARKSRRTSTSRSRGHSTRRHPHRDKSRSKRRRSRSVTSRHHHRRRSRSRRRHKRRSSRSKARYRGSSSSSDSSRDHRRSHRSPKRHSSIRRSDSRHFHHRSHHEYYRPQQERPGVQARQLPSASADCTKQPVEAKLPVGQPEPIHHYYVPNISNQASYTSSNSAQVVPRHKPRANLIEIIPTQASPSALTEVTPKDEAACRQVAIGHSKDLSDYLVEEMLLEEEVKQKEQRKIAEEKAAEMLLFSECQRLLGDLVELLCLIEHICEEKNWQTSAVQEDGALTAALRHRPVVSWLCEVDVEELNSRTTENEAAERDSSQSSSKAPITPVWPDSSNMDSNFGNQASTSVNEEATATDSGRQIVDQWLEKDKPGVQSTNGIDELMQRIFKGRNTEERIVSWISKDDVCTAVNSEPDEQSSGGDEPYDPEVEEARLNNRDDVVRKHSASEVDEHVPPLTIEELPSSATELHRIQKYRQKKQRMEQVVAVAKECIKPRYVRREIDKEQYKTVMKKTVDKYMQSGRPVNKEKISQLINYYIASDGQLT